MKYRSFEKQKRNISQIGFGGWQLGNSALWSEMSFSQGVELVKQAFHKGINFFDTAPGYSGGDSERIIGEALHMVRNQVFINTKFGHNHLNQEDFSESSIEYAVDQSLKRLQTDYLDSILLHNPPRYILEGRTKHQDEFERLKSLGKILAWGVSIDSLEELRLVLDHLDVDVIEIMFNINHQAVKQHFDEVKKKGILLIAKIPLDSGWLTGKYGKSSQFSGIRARWSEEDILIRSEIITEIKNIVNDDDIVKFALSFILSFDAVTTIIPGMKNIKQLDSNIQSCDFNLDESIKQKLESLYINKIQPKKLVW